MRFPLFLAATSLALCAPMFHAKPDEGTGSAAKTDLEKLQDAEAEVKTLKQQLADEQKARTSAETAKTNAETAQKTAADQLATVTGERDGALIAKGELATKLKAAEAEVTKLKGESKTSDQKAQEIAAAHGSQPAPKDTDTAAGGTKDGKALYEQYAKLDGREAAEFWDKHSKELIAFGKAEEARARRND